MAEPDTMFGREAVAEEIRALLARRRIRHSELAKVLGLSQPAMSRRLTGDLPFDIDELQLIATFLNVDVKTLVASVPRHPEWRDPGSHEGDPVTIWEPYVTWLMRPEPLAA